MLLAIILGAGPINEIAKHEHSPWLWGEVSLDSIANQVVVLLLMASGSALGSWRVYQSSGMDWNILIYIAPLVLGVCGGVAYAKGLKASGPQAPPAPLSI